jgi:Ca2+-binding EF-hand superfamily protein
VLVFLGTSILILCTTSAMDCVAGSQPKGLPPWFEALDKNGDGQISLREWLAGGKKLDDFRKFDLNDDGVITPDEVLGPATNGNRLTLVDGQVSCQGNIEASSETYHNKKSFKSFTIHLQAGRSYQFEQVSQVYFAYLYLEGPDGTILDRNDSGGNGRTARIVHQAAETGTYRVIATSQGGFRTGPFSISVRILSSSSSKGPKGLPPWFETLDKNRDGQISLHEWLAGGKKLDDFRKLDLNDDGFITVEEILPPQEKRLYLKLEKGKASYAGAIEASDEQYRSKRLTKILTVRMEAGKTYQIDHKSRAFDAYLYLEGPDGEVLARDDDGGGNLDSRIVHPATTTGTYRLIATSLNGNATGAFSISVRVVDGSSGPLPTGSPEPTEIRQRLKDLLQRRAGGNPP